MCELRLCLLIQARAVFFLVVFFYGLMVVCFFAKKQEALKKLMETSGISSSKSLNIFPHVTMCGHGSEDQV
jgi:hypothetical protein